MSAPSTRAAGPLSPISVLTGFLGAGKTTLLNRLLVDPGMDGALVLINEFGEIGLDHHLVAKVDADMVLMASGCLCCTIQSDLGRTLRDVTLRRAAGQGARFDRVVVETTGLADPAPIIHTLMTDPIVATHYRLDGVVTCVDAVLGEATLDRQPEAVKQAALADRLVLTKTDLASAAARAALEARLAALNPAAPRLDAAAGEARPAKLFGAGLYNPDTLSLDARRWLNAEAYEHHGHGHAHGHEHDHDHDHRADQSATDVNRHDARIRATCLTFDQPFDWDAFAAWADETTRLCGPDLLRLKAMLAVAGQSRPVVVHGVQHLFHPPVMLPDWPDDDHRSRVVIIARDLDPAKLRAGLAGCLASPG